MLREVDTLVVDKTGTLTEGKPELVTVRGRRRRATRTTLLRLAAGLERGSEHPLAAAIVAGAEQRGLELAGGRGVRVGHRQGRDRAASTAGAVALGNRALLDELGRRAGRPGAARRGAARATARP